MTTATAEPLPILATTDSRTCSNCRLWREFDMGHGHCRRHAPVMDRHGNQCQPHTRDDDTCGDFEPGVSDDTLTLDAEFVRAQPNLPAVIDPDNLFILGTGNELPNLTNRGDLRTLVRLLS